MNSGAFGFLPSASFRSRSLNDPDIDVKPS